MKKWPLLSLLIFAFLMLLMLPQAAFATHNRAGEITYYFTGPNTINATISTWTKYSSTPADRDSLQINWGDGTFNVIARVNGQPGGCCGVPNGVYLGNDIKYNIYLGSHTYAGAPPPPNNFFVVSMADPNRNAGIVNIEGGNSVNVQFYIEDTVFFPTNVQNIGYDASPVCLNPPIDFAYVGDTFWHNPACYDVDGDSISYRMIIPLQAQGLIVPGYVDPTHIYPGPEPTDTETLNIYTGMYMWATPQTADIYNVAFLISWFRRGTLMGTIDRDMQIIVLDDTTEPPVVIIPMDTCIRAGDAINARITGTNSAGYQVTLTGYGGPLAGDPTIFPDSLSPASFVPSSGGGTTITGDPALGQFIWQTVCLDIQEQPYEIVFKAQSASPQTGNPKVDLKTWDILVIPPPPLNLTSAVTANKKDIQLHWTNPYLCGSIHTFRGYSIWRRVGSNNFTPAYCETGLAGRGYTMIASGVYDTTFIDTDPLYGEDMCYRILANFYDESPNGLYDYNAVVSVPSNETCIYLPYDVPIITTVSVLQTSTTAGQMFVAWTRPRVDSVDFDTTFYLPPYRFDLYRGTGFNFATPSLLQSFQSSTFAGLIDTTYIDKSLNTNDSAYSYQVYLYSDNDTVGPSNQASSIYLSIYATDQQLRLSWNYNVPWLQDSFQIFRQKFSVGSFNYVATVGSVQSYVDNGLINDSTYCYYVKSYGHYTSYVDSILTDSSQIKCAIPVDTVPPCPPVVTISNNCNPIDTPINFVNYLTWTISADSCDLNTVEYRIYYTPDTGGTFHLIDSVQGINNTSFNDTLISDLAGCYVVTAVNKRGYESYWVNQVNEVCIDDCPNYNLPNTFTPNGDGVNDLYTPYPGYRFISRIEMKIYNRWGDKVFETTDPQINWNGKDQKTGKDLSDGVYLYGGYYYEQTLHGEIRKPLPHKNGGGFIHLIRGK